MKKLQDKANVNAPDSTWPFGEVRNKTGSTPGTKWDKEMMSDIIQFFSKLFDESGLTANGLEDNDVNGFQLFEAFQKYSPVKRAYLEIGDWDMDADMSKTVDFTPLGITTVLNVQVSILDDSGVHTPFSYGAGWWFVGPTVVSLNRPAAGVFDSTSYDSTSYNRGFVIVEYI